MRAEETLEGVTRIISADEGPTAVIVGGVHGDEPCGRVAIERLAKAARDGALPLLRGALILVHGNPEASAANARTSPGGVDLNRLFDFRFESILAREEWSYEHHRALSLRPILESADAVLDLHSASAPTPPFAIVTEHGESFEVARELGLPFVTHGWEGPGLIGDRVLLAVPREREKPAIAVECGAHDDMDAPEIARQVALRFCARLGMWEDASPSVPPPRLLRICDAIKRPGPGFRFAEPIEGMDALDAGTLVGGDANVELRMRRGCRAVMPNDRVPVGDDMLYLALDEGPMRP